MKSSELPQDVYQSGKYNNKTEWWWRNDTNGILINCWKCNSTATLENRLAVRCGKHNLTTCPSNAIPRYLCKRNGNFHLHKNLYLNIYNNFIYCHQKLATIQYPSAGKKVNKDHFVLRKRKASLHAYNCSFIILLWLSKFYWDFLFPKDLKNSGLLENVKRH